MNLSDDLLLHPATTARLRVLDQMHGSYIFAGPESTGKLTLARQLARKLDAGNYSDFIIIEPMDKPSIGISQVQQLQHDLSLSPRGKFRVVVINPADKITPEGQNCLLKTLEEPPLGTFIILITERLDELLETVKSRGQIVYFLPVAATMISQYLNDNLKVSLADATKFATMANGAVGLAIKLLKEPERMAEYEQLIELANQINQSAPFSRLVMAPQLAEKEDQLERLIGILTRQEQLRLRQPESSAQKRGLLTGTSRLEAIERYNEHLMANVSLKTALSGLLLKW